MKSRPNRTPPRNCPVCGDTMALTRLSCPSCETELAGNFESCEFCALGAEDPRSCGSSWPRGAT